MAHTDPNLSNSGLDALFAEAYAALGKFDGVTRRDISNQLDKVSSYLHGVEHSIVHYGTSTGFLADRMFTQGPDYLSAAILYENLVIQANEEARQRNPAVELPQIVAIYPAEGTFPSATRSAWSNGPGSPRSTARPVDSTSISCSNARSKNVLSASASARPTISRGST